jgi:iron complex transport system permease protein
MKIFKLYRVGFLILLLVLLVVASTWSLLSGDINISWKQLPYVLQHADSMEYSVLMNLRVPRLLLAFAVGASLSLSGVILQGIYRNPLVEPFTLGISGGASLGVALIIVSGTALSLGSFLLPVAGFAGAFITIFLVYVLGMGKSAANINRMLLTGVMISFVCSSLLMFLLSISTTEDMHNIIFWTMGSLEQPDGRLIRLMLFCSIGVFLLTHLFAHALNALRLGEDEAIHLGINVKLTIRVLFVLASLLTGLCVSIAGIIGFVGLVIPHLMRRAVGSDYRILLSASFLGGGLFLIVCDVLARTLIAPNELPVGVLTGITGGVLFIILLSRKGAAWKK